MHGRWPSRRWGRAAEQAKEFEIELKVATGQRQHAQAVIESINDAVLVTDPFDELLLANSAAGEVLGFEPEAAQRRPLAEVVKNAAVTGNDQPDAPERP